MFSAAQSSASVNSSPSKLEVHDLDREKTNLRSMKSSAPDTTIPVGLRVVEEALLAEVRTLAGPRYARSEEHPDVVRWRAQDGSIYLADQKLPAVVPRVRDRLGHCEMPLATYAALQTSRATAICRFRISRMSIFYQTVTWRTVNGTQQYSLNLAPNLVVEASRGGFLLHRNAAGSHNSR
jgi:hypothetical protein